MKIKVLIIILLLCGFAGAQTTFCSANRDCTVSGNWTFPTPTAASNPATKAYVDANASGGLGAISPANMVAQYLLNEGTGTTVADTSGAGNTATLPGSNAPTWVAGGGLQFANVGAGSTGNSVPLPAALNSAKTITFAYTFGPFWGNTYALGQNNPTLLGASGTTGPYLRLTIGLPGASSNPKHAGLPSISSTTAHITYAYDFRGVGTHTLTYVLGTSGTSLDHIYIDGQEVGGGGAYNVQGASGALLTSGNWILGGSTALASPYFSGTIHGIWMWSDEKSAATVAENAKAIRGYLESKRGISFVPKSWEGTFANSLRLLGDSITFGGSNGATPWSSLLTLNDTYSIANMGVSGFWTQDMIANIPARANYAVKTSGKQLDIIWVGTNDINGGRTAADAFHGLVTSVRADKSNGNQRVMVIPMLSRATGDTGKNTLNPLIQQYWPTFADSFCNVSADARLGANTAYNNATYFNSVDKTHPTTTGNGIIAAQISNCVNEFFGSTATTWSTTSAATYAEAAADQYLEANNSAVSLPDCTAGYGRPRYVKSVGGTTTVAPFSGQFIDGSATPIALPVGGVSAFQPYTADYAVAGCTWRTVQATGVSTTTTTSGTSVKVNGGTALANANLSSSTPAPASGFVNATVATDVSNNIALSVPATRAERHQFVCNTVFPNSATTIAPFMGGQIATLGCTQGPALYAGVRVETAGTVKNLCVEVGVVGLNASSGAFTVWKSTGGGSFAAQALTLTMGATAINTQVCDRTHSFTVVQGDSLQVRAVSQSGETLGLVNGFFDITTP